MKKVQQRRKEAKILHLGRLQQKYRPQEKKRSEVRTYVSNREREREIIYVQNPCIVYTERLYSDNSKKIIDIVR